MKSSRLFWSTCVLAIAVFSLVAGYASTSAAQKSGKSGAAKSKSDTDTVRLPNYYGKVSTEEQKPKLRDVVTKFAPKIAKKRAELRALIDERDAALDDILTAEQRSEIAKLRAAADGSGETDTKSKAKKSKAAKKAA